MVYTSQSHLSGSTITAAHANNWEEQYSEIKKTYFDRFSTASTGTTLLSVASTYTYLTLTTMTHMSFLIPPGVQKSRFELSVTQRRGSTLGGTIQIFVVPGNAPFAGYGAANYSTYVTLPYSASFAVSNTTAAAGASTSIGFTAWGGGLWTIAYSNPTSTDFFIWNTKISATSTTLIDDSCSFIPWTTSQIGTPTSTG